MSSQEEFLYRLHSNMSLFVSWVVLGAIIVVLAHLPSPILAIVFMLFAVAIFIVSLACARTWVELLISIFALLSLLFGIGVTAKYWHQWFVAFSRFISIVFPG